MKPKAPSHLLSTLTALFCTTTFLNAQTPPPCPSTLNNFVLLDQSTVFYYALLPSTAADGETPNGILCGRVEHDGESWIAVAVAETADEMVGGEAIIGLPDDNSVLKYDMTGKSADLVTPMGESMQTLWDDSIVQENGKTVMTFTKWLVEENELEISEGWNDFLFASGSSNSLAYHATRTGVRVDLLAEEWDVLTTSTSSEVPITSTTTTASTMMMNDATTTEAATTTDVTTTAAATSTEVASATEASAINDPTIEAAAATSEAATTTNAITTTLIPTSTSAAQEGLDCTLEFCENELTSGYLQRYKINVPEGQDPGNCEGCSISMELIYEGDAWLSIGFTEDGRMIGSEAVM